MLSLGQWFSPYKQICQVPIEQVKEHICKLFDQWGLPEKVKVDHGRPLGDPTRLIIPPLALWLIGLDIEVVYIRPATPTDNPKVERMQGVTANWAEPHRCSSIKHLQQELDLVIDIQRNHYPSRVCGKMPRAKAFPQLNKGGRPFEPEQFSLQPIYQALQHKSWSRTVSKVGQINLGGCVKSVGVKFKQQQVEIGLNLQSQSFIVTDQKQQTIKTFSAKLIIEKWLNPLFQIQRTSCE